jgi:hypothetical protein
MRDIQTVAVSATLKRVPMQFTVGYSVIGGNPEIMFIRDRTSGRQVSERAFSNDEWRVFWTKVQQKMKFGS